ncbi:hypothetical protein SAMN04488595_101449 [Ralstonia sp. 25mfcol4.1]|uniref:hypothetical protein n=1 Tax=Ralstonia sp. 25mfcol4.1 TaxID=1761899 RepID=UPI00087F2D61|nr:hypothetical protein [Ralstonia sp. 25mfcol4.1]SDO66517.1 hypothetical protein SAMN04488595_101449 [Ralstonia sp. 25mfcol4.1]
MDQTTTTTIHSEHVKGDKIQFTVTVHQGDKTWNYAGIASASALTMLGPDTDIQMAFDAHRAKFAEKARQDWRQQAFTYMFSINSTNVLDGGGFVNNG